MIPLVVDRQRTSWTISHLQRSQVYCVIVVAELREGPDRVTASAAPKCERLDGAKD